MIYKVCQRAEWLGAEECGHYTGSEDDERDGFVHFSTADQLAATLAKHYSGQTDLVLVGVDENRLGSAIKWEPSKAGGSAESVLYPHLYGVLDIMIVEWVRPIRQDDAGGHIIPDGLF